MGCCNSQPDATPAEELNILPLRDGLDLNARVVIVGGGPAGIHMASRLHRRGFENVIVLEKGEAGAFGKTHTLLIDETGDTPHEMGTCYLSWSYKTIRQLIAEYLGEGSTIDPGGELFSGLSIVAPRTDALKGAIPTTHSSEDWLYAHSEATRLPDWEGQWDFIPDKLQALPFLVDVIKYRKLHESLLGKYDYHGLPPKPGTESLAKLNCTFEELMTKNGLKALLDLTCVGFGSYGFSYNVPALYGLWFVTPTAVESYLASKIDAKVKTVELVRDGYSSLWRAMVEKDKINVRYGACIQRINRHLDEPARAVEIALASGETVECDLLVFAAPLWSQFLALVSDATLFEREVCSSLTTVGLVVSLLRTEKKQTDATPTGERSLTFYANSLMPEFTPDPQAAKAVYAERNSVRAFRPEREASCDKRYTVAYQYLPAFESDATQATRAAIDFITSSELAVEPTAVRPPPELLYQKNWDYFPHFTQEAVQKLIPWRLLEAQGANKTWYIGSSCCFESVEDVTSYNDLVLHHKLQAG